MKTNLNKKLNPPVKVGDRVRVCFDGGRMDIDPSPALYRAKLSLATYIVVSLRPFGRIGRIAVNGVPFSIRSWVRIRD